MKVAVEHIFNGTTASLSGAYDSTKTMLGSLMRQVTSGTSGANNYVTVGMPPIINIGEIANTTYAFPCVRKKPGYTDVYLVFVAQNSGAAQTRTLGLFEFNSTNLTVVWKGFITMNSGVAGNKTVRGFEAYIYTHTDGTVAVSGTTVTGTSTTFSASRIAAANAGVGGARIGFGSTNPSQITAWYEISSIASDTSLTLKTSVPSNINAGTAYVIEEIRLAVACTNATATNAAIHLIKGLNYDTFAQAGTTISDAVSTDNLCATYTIRDSNATLGIQTIVGIGADETATSTTQHDLYLLNIGTPDAATAARIYKFNMRAALTVASGISTTPYLFRTGIYTITGTVTQLNNGKIFTVSHGAASGVKSMFFTTTTRIYRIPISSIADSVTNFVSDFAIENVPGGNNINYSTTSSLSSVDYVPTVDRIIVNTGNNRFGFYIGQYDTTGSVAFDKLFGGHVNRLKLAATPSGSVNGLFPSTTSTFWCEDTWLFTIPNSTTNGLNWFGIFPIGADGFYAQTTLQRIITPKLATTDATKLYRSYVDTNEYAGSYPLGFPTESYEVFYRTSGINDNTGSWSTVPLNGDLTGVSPGTHIQFMFELDVLGEMCVPPQIFSVACVYEDGSQDSHYQPSLTKSSAANRRFAWRQVALWGYTNGIPNLRIRLYNADTGYLVLDDNINSSAYGTFEYSADGSTWNAWDDSQDEVGYYIRYTATSLPSNITVRALLTLA